MDITTQIKEAYGVWLAELETLAEQITGNSLDLFDSYTGFSHHEFTEDFILGLTPIESLSNAIDTLTLNWRHNLMNRQTSLQA